MNKFAFKWFVAKYSALRLASLAPWTKATASDSALSCACADLKSPSLASFAAAAEDTGLSSNLLITDDTRKRENMPTGPIWKRETAS